MVEEKVLTAAKEYADAVRERMDVRDIFLYGSYARGEAKKGSDIDIAVVTDQISGDYLDTMASLWRLTNNVNENIEPVLLLTSDDESGFLDTVRRTGIAV